jgi:hypothetical protein
MVGRARKLLTEMHGLSVPDATNKIINLQGNYMKGGCKPRCLAVRCCSSVRPPVAAPRFSACVILPPVPLL